MAIGVKKVRRPEEGTSYVRAALKGMALTFRHLVDRDKVTQQYPDEKPNIAPRWRGTHRMEVHADGRPKCVACGLCPTICPANCIRLVPGEDDQGNRYPIVYEIDEFRCIFCGMCQEVCPVEAIHVGQDYEAAEFTRERFVYDLDRLMAQDHPVTGALGSERSPVRIMAELIWWVFAPLAVGGAVGMVGFRNPVASLLSLVLTLFSLGVLFILMNAHFIGVIQVIVYAGAIMVLFLFVIMLLNLGHDYRSDIRGVGWIAAASVLAGVVFWMIANTFLEELPVVAVEGPGTLPADAIEAHGVVGALAMPLFEDYVVGFELVALLLLAAIIGAMLLAKRRV